VRQLVPHPLRGAFFEIWVVPEVLKAHLPRGRRPRRFFYRVRGGLEIDLVLAKGGELVLVEIKSAWTPAGRYFSGLTCLAEVLAGREAPRSAGRIVVCGGGGSHSGAAGASSSPGGISTRSTG